MANMLNKVTVALEQIRALTSHLEELHEGIRNAELTPQQQPQPQPQTQTSSGSNTLIGNTATTQQQSNQPLQLNNDQTRRIRDSFSCTICVDYFESPYTLQCGHTFCKDCVTTWFARQKSCPQCRRDIFSRPVPAYTVETQVSTIRSLLPTVAAQSSIEESTPEERERAVQEFERFLDRIFPARTNHGCIRDEQDSVDRCPSCAWELDEDGTCVNCGLEFRQATQQNRRSSSSSLSSSDEDDSEEMGGFIVSDDHSSSMNDSSDDDTGSSSSESCHDIMGGAIQVISSSDEDDMMGISSDSDINSSDDDSSDSNDSSSSDDSDIQRIFGPELGSSDNSDSSSNSTGSTGSTGSSSSTSDDSSDSSNSSDNNSDSNSDNDSSSEGQQAGGSMETSSSNNSDESRNNNESSSDNSDNDDSPDSVDVNDSNNSNDNSNQSSPSSSSSSSSSDQEQESDSNSEEKDVPVLMTRKRRAALEAKMNAQIEDTTQNKRQRKVLY